MHHSIFCSHASSFTSLVPSLIEYVCLAERHLSPIEGQENIKLSSTLILKNVLYTPSLKIHYLLANLECNVVIDSHSCVFQDLLAKKKTGGGYKSQRINCLNAPHLGDIAYVESQSCWFEWHLGLGHWFY